MKKIAYLVAMAAMMTGCGTRERVLEWGQAEDGNGNLCTVYTLEGMPSGSGWQVVFSQMTDPEIEEYHSEGLSIEHIGGSLFKIAPTAASKAGRSATILLPSRPLTRYEDAPLSAFIVDRRGRCKSIKVKGHIAQKPDGEQLYEAYKGYFNPAAAAKVDRFCIIPAVKNLQRGEGSIALSCGIALSAAQGLERQKARLESELERIGICEGSLPVSMELKDLHRKGEYQIEARTEGIRIMAADAEGAFSAVASLVTFIENGDRTAIQEFSLCDSPDFPYRGYMLDVSRNFTTRDNVKRLLGELARYKVNKFQFHIVDDEGWRLEISDFPELTTLGAFHGWDENHLMPSYDGNFDPRNELSSNGFYTKEDFIDILRHAESLGIEVIPEIDVPGHSRAAVKAMEAYARRTGCNDYLLSEPEDRSEYLTAQSYRDNVINVALESSYKFLGVVMDRIAQMYAEAGLELKVIHLGGDEVPQGCWEKSPACQALMKELGISEAPLLKNHFVMRMASICKDKGLKISGWQEMPLDIERSGDDALQENFQSGNAWSTQARSGNDHIPYELANRGYGVILANVTNTYVDQANTSHPMERGLTWGGGLDARRCFALNPYNIYFSERIYSDGQRADLASVADGKPALERPEMIHGTQVHLFTETIRSFDDVTSYSFPKGMGVFERAWNAAPDWSRDLDDARFVEDFSRFYAALCAHCMPHWKSIGFAFHLPQPGLHIEDGKLHAISPVPGAEIRYTLDGSEPTEDSPLYTESIEVSVPCTIRAITCHLGAKSLASLLILE